MIEITYLKKKIDPTWVYQLSNLLIYLSNEKRKFIYKILKFKSKNKEKKIIIYSSKKKQK